MDEYSYISNADPSYIDELYSSYKNNPESVDIEWKKFFEGFEFSTKRFVSNGKSDVSEEEVQGEISVRQLIHAYRTRGHLLSNTNPIRQRKDRKPLLELENFNLSDADLEKEFSAGELLGIGRAPLKKIIQALREIYTGTVGFEYMFIRDPEMLGWFQHKSEKEALAFNPSIEKKKRILSKLNEAVVFESFLHKKYIGQKRFSLEGGETTIPALDTIINRGAELGVEEVVIGMAHRGRLNVLANIMGKTYEQIFNEFEGNAEPDLTMGDGDVKYHMGYSSQIETPSGNKIDLKLAPNPSHLEAVDPVVEGFVRAKIDAQYEGNFKKVLPVLIHGDAAAAGQGIIYEVAQMSQLEGYSTGGTIHFVINNQVGFTTDYYDARSSIYCSDIAKITDSPVLHVNGDNPEAVMFCVNLATEFRQKYQKDIWIDMVCYRKHGHNESDEPKFTQPYLYKLIGKHPNPRELYVKKLTDRGDVDSELGKDMDKEFNQLLQDRLNMVKQNPLPYKYQPLEEEWHELRRSEPKDFDKSPNTSTTEEKIKKVADALVTFPEGFTPIKQIEKLFEQRKEMFFEKKELNWAAGELLAYGTLLLDGKSVRMTGQDIRRGTFSHRHAVIKDAETNIAYSSLSHMEGLEADFNIFNSFLSEYGVMGFEFGYAMANPNALTIWEAQFGDFANGAQVMIDQFVAPSESKWQRMNGLVLLLPHGYEGQGPEHSNARPERFLQLAAEYNMVVGNFTTPANMFHALRRQLAWPFRKPLVVMSPKSLLRHPKVVSPIKDFTNNTFQEVYDDNYVTKSKTEKVLMCTGKVYFDLLEKQQSEKIKDVAIVRIEQLHPFPEKKVDAILKKYTKMKKLVWVQEEPVNMGYWSFLLRTYYKRPDMEIVARKPSASPATGYAKVHAEEQKKIVNAAFKR
ncbi:MAG: 2-oxoglutarate dehydrogenase E1 component [Bacteroidota bacterium]